MPSGSGPGTTLPELQRCHFGQKHTLEALGRSQVAPRLPPVVDEISLIVLVTLYKR